MGRIEQRKRYAWSVGRCKPTSTELTLELLESRTMLDADWQHPARPLDVNNDGYATPLDALIIINSLNNVGAASQLPSRAHNLKPYYDVNGDEHFTPLDALIVINALNGAHSEIYPSERVEGGSEPAPAGFTSVVLGELPGDSAQLISLSLAISQDGPRFNELGLFIVDDDLGSVDGLAPTHPNYADAVFAQPQRRVLYSRLGTFKSESTVDFAGGQRLGVYALQSTNRDESPTQDLTVFERDSDDGVAALGLRWRNVVVDIDQPLIVNNSPTIDAISDQTMNVTQDWLAVNFDASDLEGDPIELIARASVANPLAEIRQQYGLHSDGDYRDGLTGLDEKWLLGTGDTSFFILPNGDLIQWLGSFEETAQPASLVARLDPSVYQNPGQLLNAPDEVPAPASILLKEGQLIINPHDGVHGEITVRLAATDGKGFGVEEFALHIDPQYEQFEVENKTLEQLRAGASTLEFDEIPAFIQALNQFASELDGLAAAQVSDLAREVQARYNQTRLHVVAAEDWEAEQLRLIQSEIDTVQDIETELQILQTEYAAAWEVISERLDDAGEVNPDGPPIFINGVNIGPFATTPGEWFEVDLRAIHPSHKPFYYFPDDSVLDTDRFGDALSIHPQTGLFRWLVPAHAAGEYIVAVVAEVNGNQTAEVTFTVKVNEAVKPTIQSLTISPTTITDKAKDPITLTALGVNHPTDTVNRVYFYQDADGNSRFEHGIDLWLGRDEDGEDGWSWSGIPHPVASSVATSQTFFAVADRSTFGATHFSDPVQVNATVIQTPDEVDLVLDRDEEAILVGRTVGGVTPIPAHDADGNIAEVYKANGDLWIRTNEEIPLKLATGDFAYALAMNDRGEGLVVWQTYWPFEGNDYPLYMQAFTNAGRQLGSTHATTIKASFKDGGRWQSIDVNENGDFIVAWKNEGAWGNLSDLNAVRVVETEVTWPERVAMNDAGWSVFTDTRGALGKVFDPSGKAIGREFETQNVTPTSSDYGSPRNLMLGNDGVVAFLWAQLLGGDLKEVYHYKRNFLLNLQSDLVAQSLLVLNEYSLQAAGNIELEFVVANSAPVASNEFHVTFHLSHDETVDSADRLLGAYAVTPVSGNSTAGVLKGAFSLPPNTDPFWNSGTIGLHLVMTIAESGSSVVIKIPSIATLPVDDPIDGTGGGTGGDTGGGGTEGGGGGGTSDGSPKYIRPNIPLEQLGTGGVAQTYDVMELVGRQLVSAINSLRQNAPYRLASELQAIAKQVEVRLDTYYRKKWSLTEARNVSLDAALEAKSAAEAEADRQLVQNLAVAQTQLDRVRDGNLTIIENQAKIANGELATERERLKGIIADERSNINAANDAITQHEQGQTGFALGSVLGELEKVGGKVDSCVANLVDCSEQAVNEFNKRKHELLKIRDDVVRKSGPVIQATLDKLDTLLPNAQAAFDELVAPIRTLITIGEAQYDKAVSKWNEKKEKAYDEAENQYDKAVAKLPDLSDGIKIEAIAAAPSLEQAQFDVDAAIGSINNPVDGILPDLDEQLSGITDANPLGSIPGIKGTGAIFSGEATLDALDIIDKVIEPAVSGIQHAAGVFADWSKDTGGKAADWTKDTGGKAAEWAKDRGDEARECLSNLEDCLTRETSRAGVFKIAVRRDDPESQAYTVEVDLGGFLDGYRGMYVRIHQAGIELASNYIPRDGDLEHYETEFENLPNGVVQISAELKDGEGDFYTQATGKNLELPFEGWVEIYYDPEYANGRTTTKVLRRATGTFGVGQVTAETEADATEARGFELPYVLSAVNLYETKNVFDLPEYVLAFDAVQLTGETEVKVEVLELDANGNDISQQVIAENQQKRDDHFAQEERLLLLDLEFRKFKLWVGGGAGFDGFQEVVDDYYEQFVLYQREFFPNDVPSQNEWFLRPNDPDDAPEGSGWNFPNGYSMWQEYYDDPDTVILTNDFAAAATAEAQLAQLPNQPDVKPVPQHKSKTLRGAEIANGLYLTPFIQQVKENHDQKYGVKVYAGNTAGNLEQIETFTIDHLILGLLEDGFKDSVDQVKQGLDEIVSGFPVFDFPETSEVLEWTHIALAVAGLTPVVGVFADGADLTLYAIQGDWEEVAVAAAAMLPAFGQGVTAAKLGDAGADVLKVSGSAIKAEGKEIATKVLLKADPATLERILGAGMTPSHASKLGDFAQETGTLVIVRKSNPKSLAHHPKDGHLPKPVNLKLKTDEAEGLVKGSKGSDGTLFDARGERTEFVVAGDGKILDRNGADQGYLLDANGYVIDANGNKFFSDYDLLEVVRKDDAYQGGWVLEATGAAGDTGLSPFVRQLNTNVTPDKAMFQHGANSEYWKSVKEYRQGNQTILGNPYIGDEFIVADIDGSVKVLDLAQLKKLYKEKFGATSNIRWPVD